MPEPPAPAVVRFVLNGTAQGMGGRADVRLLDVLRDELGLKGTRLGCGAGQCGACHVLVDGRSMPACDTPLRAVAGCRVTTVEGLGAPDMPAGLREAFIAEQAAQCGFCTSGLLVAAAALLLREPDPSEARVREALDGHLCRCGVHNRVVRAVLRAARAPR